MKPRIIYYQWAFGILMVGDAHPTGYRLPAFNQMFCFPMGVLQEMHYSILQLFFVLQ
jgi:hypothetical protein